MRYASRVFFQLSFIAATCTLGSLGGCSGEQSNTEQEKTNEVAVTKLQAPQPLQIVSEEEDDGLGNDMRLSIVEQWESDTATHYKAVSIYEGKELGLIASIPKHKERAKGFAEGFELKRSGVESDHLLKVLATLYGQKVDSTVAFVDLIRTPYVNLNEFAKNITGVEEQNSTSNDYKLFFEGSGEDQYAEIYLNIYPKEKWLEIREKDEEYRPEIIRFFKQPSK